MKVYLCPECKEAIPDGKLWGNNQNCQACKNRVSRQDLIEVDTEDLIKAANIQQQPAGNPWNSYQNPSINPLKNLTENVDIPVIHKLSELRLPCGVKWIKSQDNFNSFNPDNTLFFKYDGSVAPFAFSIIWLLLTIPFLGAMLVSFISDPASVKVNGHPGKMSDIWMIMLFPLFFWGIGGVMLYIGIKQAFYKNWLEITPDSIIVEQGYSRKGKLITFKRNSSTKVLTETVRGSKGHISYKVNLVDDNHKIEFKSGLAAFEAREYERMLRTILNAEL